MVSAVGSLVVNSGGESKQPQENVPKAVVIVRKEKKRGAGQVQAAGAAP